MKRVGQLFVRDRRVMAIALIGAKRALRLLECPAGVFGFAFEIGGVEISIAKQ